jgi:quercetin dioxygenase-like cupin family protein
MTTVTGRTLDENGDPIPGTGFEYEEDGLIADLLAQRVGPLNSHPTRPTWGTPLERPDEGHDRVCILSIFGPGFEGPPEHYHEVSVETFDVRQGTVTFTADDSDYTVTAGETLVVETGTRHTFNCPGDELTVVVTTIAPLGRIGYVLSTLSGIAHDPTVDADDPLQRALIAKRLHGDTVFTEAESGVRRVATDVLAPLAKLRGYQGGYGRYRQDAFWERHVEQPV